MPVHTLADVDSFNAYQRGKLVGRVTGATEEQRTWRPAPGKWSLLEHLEHIALSNIATTDTFEQLVARARRDGLTATPETPRLVDAIPALQAAGAVGSKKQAPEFSQPRGRSLEEILQILERERRRALACAEALPHLDTDQVLHFQPVADVQLNLAQFWHFQGIHEAQHASHMQDILSAWSAARGA